MLVETLIEQAAACKASDLHIAYGVPPKVRRDGELQDLEGFAPLTDQDCETVAQELLGESMPALGERDLSIELAGRRVRVNLFRQSGHVSAALRILADSIPELDALGLPPAVQNFPALQRGIVLVTGETGSGKSTTLAAILRRINETRRDHIITLEDPIEFLHRDQKSIISQREIAIDTADYLSGLRACLRQAPDVILLGEMRDHETIRTAMTAAETGHLIIATLHTRGAVNTIDRIIDTFPPAQQNQIRIQLSTVLHTVVSQQLIPDLHGCLVPAYEIMHMNSAIRSMIRDSKDHQIDNAIATGAADGMISMDQSVLELYRSGRITRETALEYAENPEQMSRKLD